jgi:hypothetical protein
MSSSTTVAAVAAVAAGVTQVPVKKFPVHIGRSMSCAEFSTIPPQLSSTSIDSENYLFPCLEPPSVGCWDLVNESVVSNGCGPVAPSSSSVLSESYLGFRVMDDLDVNYHYPSSEASATPRSDCSDLYLAVNNNNNAAKVATINRVATRPIPLPPLNLPATAAHTPVKDSTRRSLSMMTDRGCWSSSCYSARQTTQSPSTSRFRDRSCSLPDVAEMDCFIQLDTNWSVGLRNNEPPNSYLVEHQNVLSVLVSKADAGMKSGIDPVLADGALGGTYFLRDSNRDPCIICKPGDEEPNAPWNPHSPRNTKWSAYKGRIIPGFGMYREVATYLLNGAFVGVPPTALARVRHRNFRSNSILKHKPVPILNRSLNQSPATTIGSVLDSSDLSSNSSGTINSRTSSMSSSISSINCGSYEVPKQRGVSLDSYEASANALTERLGCDLHVTGLGVSPVSTSAALSADGHTTGSLHCSSVEEVWESTFSHKPCSVQAYAKHKCSAEDFGPGMFNHEDVQRIAMLDIRMCNLDRHEGNYLVAESNPYSMLSDGHDGDKKFRLIPIDHGYCLPHVLCMNGASLSWLYWPQVKQPVSPAVAEYIANIDINADIARLKRYIGVAMPEPCLLTLRVCTMFLQKGVAAGLTLSDIGCAMTESLDGEGDCLDDMDYKYCEVMSSSQLMKTVVNSIKSTYAQYVTPNSSSAPITSRCNSSSSSPLSMLVPNGMSRSPPKSPAIFMPPSPPARQQPSSLPSPAHLTFSSKSISSNTGSSKGSGCISSIMGRMGIPRSISYVAPSTPVSFGQLSLPALAQPSLSLQCESSSAPTTPTTATTVALIAASTPVSSVTPPPFSSNSLLSSLLSRNSDGSNNTSSATIMSSNNSSSNSISNTSHASTVSLEVKLAAAINFQNGRVFLNELELAVDALVQDILRSK